jgi:hypothetical protein
MSADNKSVEPRILALPAGSQETLPLLRGHFAVPLLFAFSESTMPSAAVKRVAGKPLLLYHERQHRRKSRTVAI